MKRPGFQLVKEKNKPVLIFFSSWEISSVAAKKPSSNYPVMLMPATQSYGSRLSADLGQRPIIPFIGVYDTYSASIAARHFDALFLSGFSFGASIYGLPDEGYIAWSDLIAATHRIRSVTPGCHLLVDMDDGYGDPGIAAHAAATLESMGASGIILEDQLRPKKCGHLDGKQVMELDGFIEKLDRVLTARRDLVVVARTDAAEPEERLRRARAIDRTAADAILVDGVGDMQFLQMLRREVKKPIVFNQIAGGKSRPRGLGELRQAGVGLVIYSTPCLFAAHSAIDTALSDLKSRDGRLPEPTSLRVELAEVNRHLKANLATRHQQRMNGTSKVNDLPPLRGGSYAANTGASGEAP